MRPRAKERREFTGEKGCGTLDSSWPSDCQHVYHMSLLRNIVLEQLRTSARPTRQGFLNSPRNGP